MTGGQINGQGAAGTPRGGVVTVQGDPDGTPIPINIDAPDPEPALGRYTAGISHLITGATTTARLVATLNNPAASGRRLRVHHVIVDDVPSSSAVLLLIAVQRITGLPTGGTSETVAKLDTTDPNAVATVTRFPSAASVDAGYLWRMCTSQGGVARIGSYPPIDHFEDDPIYVEPGNGIAVTMPAPYLTSNRNTGVTFMWDEIAE